MEKWLDIPGYETLYQASDAGRIRTCEGKTTSNARFAKRVWKQRILKQKLVTNKRGRTDARVSLWKDCHEQTWLVSQLIALTWCKGYAPELTVNHIDGNPLNNAASNLEWTTRADNIRKGFQTGLYRKNQHLALLQNGDKILVFSSFSAASRYIGHCSGYVSNCIKKRRTAKSSNGQEYRITTL